MKQFLLVFEDLLQAHVLHEGISEPQSRIVKAESQDQLISQLGLIKRQKDPRRCYWDGTNGNILIFIHEISEKEITNREELVALVHYLACEFY